MKFEMVTCRAHTPIKVPKLINLHGWFIGSHNNVSFPTKHPKRRIWMEPVEKRILVTHLAFLCLCESNLEQRSPASLVFCWFQRNTMSQQEETPEPVNVLMCSRFWGNWNPCILMDHSRIPHYLEKSPVAKTDESITWSKINVLTCLRTAERVALIDVWQWFVLSEAKPSCSCFQHGD